MLWRALSPMTALVVAFRIMPAKVAALGVAAASAAPAGIQAGSLVAAFLATAIWAAGAAAQTLQPLDSQQTGRAWDAVGRLEIDGTDFCTGALIAEDIVLTAAHCLFDPETGARVSVDRLQFRAGWRNGRASAYRRAAHAVVHSGFDYAGGAGADRVGDDLALIALQHPIRNMAIAPFTTGAPPRPGDRVGVVSYAHDRAEAPSLETGCGVLARQDRMVVLDCIADFGSSGAPVFRFTDSGPRIVSVISAKAQIDGGPVSLGSEIAPSLTRLRAALDTAGRQTLRADTRRDTGAKFVVAPGR